MPQLSRGQKIKIEDLTTALQLHVGIGAASPVLSFDISCFGVDGNGRLSDDSYFVFYNQPTSPEGAIRIIEARSGDTQSFSLDLAALPSSIQRLVFVMTIDGEGEMRDLGGGYFRLEAGNQEIARFAFVGSDFATEKAIMVAEIYRKDVWRLAAVGQGFAGGLPAVLAHFGGQEVDEVATPGVEVASAPPIPTPVPAPPSLINLSKAGSSAKINLQKTVGEIIATARWVDNGDNCVTTTTSI